VTFSDRAKGKIRAIDGYEIMPRAAKEVNRSLYSDFPDPKDRHRIYDKTRRELRAWYRKYPTPKEQADNPFETWVPDRSPYQIIREVLQAQLEYFGVSINSKSNPLGQIAAKHYMPLLQKLTTLVYPHILDRIYNLGGNYDFENDPKGVKSKRVRKHTLAILQSKDIQGRQWIDKFLTNNVGVVFYTLIPQAIQLVDNGRGVLTHQFDKTKDNKFKLTIFDDSLKTGSALPPKFSKAQLRPFLPKK
jgi:hypothetical protein